MSSGASWTSVLFDISQNKIKKFPLMDPLRGTKRPGRGTFSPKLETAAALLAKLFVLVRHLHGTYPSLHRTAQLL